MAKNWDMVRLFESVNKTKIKGSLIKESFEGEQEFSDNAEGINQPNPTGDDSDYNDILNSYLETALWADAEEGDEEMKSKTIHDFDPQSKAEALNDIKAFVKIAGEQAPEELRTYSDEQLGHNLWLSRNGHGAGFFDDNNDKLQDIARNMKEKYIYIGDDKGLYMHEDINPQNGLTVPKATRKKLAKDLRAGDQIVGLGTGLLVTQDAVGLINTPTGKVELIVKYPNGTSHKKIWNKNTVISVYDKTNQQPAV